MKKVTVVIVEDDGWLAASYSRTLEKHGIIPHYVPHALAAIEAIDTLKPDILLLDMLLAGTTAMTLLHELQSHPDLARIPTIILTNLGDSVRLKDVKPYGVRDVIDKSTMQPDDIVKAIRRILP